MLDLHLPEATLDHSLNAKRNNIASPLSAFLSLLSFL